MEVKDLLAPYVPQPGPGGPFPTDVVEIEVEPHPEADERLSKLLWDRTRCAAEGFEATVLSSSVERPVEPIAVDSAHYDVGPVGWTRTGPIRKFFDVSITSTA